VCFSSSGDAESSQQVWASGDFLSRFGHSIALVRDLDGDSVPDVAVGSPGAMWGTAAVHSMRTGKVIVNLDSGDAWIRWGSDTTATTDGRHVMVSGGTPTVPELFHFPAAAQVHELIGVENPRAVLHRAWSWAPPVLASER
jgi:hypothetical protein